jgi:hypothetical protein
VARCFSEKRREIGRGSGLKECEGWEGLERISARFSTTEEFKIVVSAGTVLYSKGMGCCINGEALNLSRPIEVR